MILMKRSYTCLQKPRDGATPQIWFLYCKEMHIYKKSSKLTEAREDERGKRDREGYDASETLKVN